MWLLRIEDVDRARTVAGAEAAILRVLEACGLHWDEAVMRQSTRTEAYAAALARLEASGAAYGCACSRSEIEAHATTRALDGGWRYPGTCRGGLPAGRAPRAWRLALPDAVCGFDDRLQGRVEHNLAAAVGDCVLWRADGVAAYQLAVVVDDAEQCITDVVRGADLIDATPRQIFLQRCLALPTPRYLHLPLAVNAAGEKLSKQTRAPALDVRQAAPALAAALAFLGHPPPQELAGAPPAELLAWAVGEWNIARLPAQRSIVVPAGEPTARGARAGSR